MDSDVPLIIFCCMLNILFEKQKRRKSFSYLTLAFSPENISFMINYISLFVRSMQ